MTCPSKEEEATGVDGARWLLRDGGTRIADTTARRTSGEGVEHQAPASVLDIEGDQVSLAQHVEQARPKRRAFATSFHASNM